RPSRARPDARQRLRPGDVRAAEPAGLPILPGPDRRANSQAGAEDSPRRADRARRGGVVREPARVLITQCCVGLLAPAALPAARRDHPSARRRQHSRSGRFREGSDGGRTSVAVGVDQRQPHAALGELVVSSPYARDRRLPADNMAAPARGGSAAAVCGLPGGRASQRGALSGGHRAHPVDRQLRSDCPRGAEGVRPGHLLTCGARRGSYRRAGPRVRAWSGCVCGDGLRELQLRDLRSATGRRGLPPEPASGLSFEPDALLPLGLHVPGASALGGRRRPGAGERRPLDRRAVQEVTASAAAGVTTLPPTLPRYGQSSLADLASSVLASLGVAAEPNPLQLAPAGRVCLLIVDGLGWEQLREHPAAAPFLSELARAGRPLTAGFPAMTATSLGSLGTGRPPGPHGMLGYQVAVPGAGRLLNTLRWDRRVDPVVWQPGSTIFERAAASGISAFRVAHSSLGQTGLSVATMRGAVVLGADTFGALVGE